MNWRRNRYEHTWWDFLLGWAIVIVGGPIGLMILGFLLKLIWNCFMVGWEMV